MDLQHLRASDGTGEAVLAHVQTVRNPGSTVLDLDNVDNWNSKAVIITGTPAANGFVSPVGMKVMYGHLNAGDFIIDGFAPGYVDNGNTTAEVAIVKMTTSWSDTLISLLGVSLQDNGKLKTTSLDDFFKPVEVNKVPYVASGGIIAISAGLIGTFSNIVFYYGGLRQVKTGVPNKTYTASKDTYVDITSAGVVSYNEVANGAAAPALAALSIRLAKVVTSGAAITSIVQTASDGPATNNLIYPTASKNNTDISLLSNIGNLSQPGATGNFAGGNNLIGGAITLKIPENCTKVLVVGKCRLQAQAAGNIDCTVWVGMDGVTGTEGSMFTGVGTFNSATVPILDELAVAPGSTHTFQCYGSASGAINASLMKVKIIPLVG